MKFKKKTLANGLRIITVPMKDNPSVTVMVLVETGSNYETKAQNGLSHFLEHMFFKGTKKRPTSKDVHRELDGLGAQSNAFTSNEFTAYYAKVEKKQWRRALDIVSDMYLNSTLPKAEMEKERGVILQEISMKEDNPSDQVWDVLSELLHGDTPAGRTILGFPKNIKNFSIEDFIEYRRKHYIAEKTYVVVAGNLNDIETTKEIVSTFKNIPTGKVIDKLPVKNTQNKPALLVKQKKTDQTHIMLAFRAFKAGDKRSAIANVIVALLGMGFSSRLFHKLRDEMGVCYYVRADNESSTDHGTFIISSGVDRNRLEEVVKVLIDECKKFTTEKVSLSELKKTKDFLIGNLYLGLETSDSLAVMYAIQEAIEHKMKTPQEIEKEIRKVTAKDIQKVAKYIFKTENINLAIVGDVKNEARLKRLLKF